MAKNYKCPYCEKRLIRKDLITHINRSHKDLIPESYTAARLVYNIANKTEYGRCRVCGKETQWSEKNGRYNVLCGSSKCKEYMREEYKKNMLRVKGTYNILNDPEQQKIMLANRSISGKYKFQDGGEHIFTGSYEKKCLEFMDIVMQISSDDIMSPGPTLEYEYNGQKHFYIADFYYIPYNLIIEVKDGGDNINTKDSASMRASREKTIEKERIITDKGEYNYIRLTNNNFAQLIEVFMDIKDKLLRGDDSKTYKINESQTILEGLFGYSYYIKAGTEKTTKCFYDSTIITKKAAVYCAISSNIQSKLQANGYMPGYENKYKITIVKAGNYAFENKKFTLYKVNKKDEIGASIETMTLKEFADKYKIKYEIDNRDANDLAKIKKEIKRVQGFIKTEFNRYSIFKKYEMETEMYNEEESIEAYANRQQHDVNIVMIHCPYSRLNDESEMKEVETAGESLIKNVNNKILPDSKIIVEWDHLNMLISLKMLKGYTESQIIAEDYFVDKKDIYYNKDKFDSGEINLCFITGLSGSGKTTMGKTMQSGNIEVCELDDIVANWNVSDANLKEYGGLVYSFFKGPGKMYRYTSYDEWMNDSKWDNPTNPYVNSYDAMIIKDFVKYAKSYANSHKTIKFVLEGVWVFHFIDPKELDSYAVYIKGTSVLISFIRSAKRDCQDANSNMEKFGAFIKIVTSIGRMKAYLSDEKRLLQFYEYFASKVINESQVVLENTNISDTRNVINKIHQKYLKDKKPPTGNQNCQLCTWCVESWFRGINVLPRPIYSPTDIVFKFNGYDIVKNPELIKFISKEDFKRVIHSSGNGSRYYVHVKWNGGSGGHEFMAIDIDNIIYIIDAQQGIIENMDTSYAVKDYFNINYDESYMVRLDNKQFNKELLKYNNNKYIKQLTEDDMKMLEEDAIDESLEDVSGVVFGKRKLIQDKYITLYHGTSIKDLPLISPLSINVGLKNANPKMSSFWFNNLDYAITFSTMDYIARNLNDKDTCKSMVLDNDMKVLIDNKYKSKVIASIKNGESYVYERTVESKYVGYGHNGVFPEYTLDIPVKPDRYYVIKFKEMVSKIKFVSENYIKLIKQKYADGKMDFGNNKMQLLMDRVFYYSGHNDRVDKIKQAKAYNKISLNDILYLNKMLNQYEYIIPNNGNIITQISEDSFNKYKLLSPDEFKKYKGGICWDYVVYEAYWFDKYFTNIPYSVYFEVLDNKIDCPTHTFLIFEYGGKYYWFESSWKPMCGIYGGFDTEKDAIDYVMSKLNDGKSNYKNYICEYDPLDSKMFGMNSKQFMDYLLPKVKPYKFPNRVETPTTVIKGTTPEHKSY